MDSLKIRYAVTSVTRPGVHLGDSQEGAHMARRVNEFLAQLAADHPSRFGFFASLPLPDVSASVLEAKHALDKMEANGVILLANARGQYVGDSALSPLFKELDHRAAIVFIHPNQLPGPSAPGLPPFVADFLLDTTRAALLLVKESVPSRFPNIRFILSHGGGFLPYVAHRAALRLASLGTQDEHALLKQCKQFYFDTALASSPSSLPSLLAFADPSRLLFGSDWPYPPMSMVTYFTEQLERDESLNEEQRLSIYHGNAEALFPHLTDHGEPLSTKPTEVH